MFFASLSEPYKKSDKKLVFLSNHGLFNTCRLWYTLLGYGITLLSYGITLVGYGKTREAMV